MSEPLIKGPLVLAILDGWGIAPVGKSNPISQTKLPTFDRLFAESRTAKLCAHGQCVGLPKDQDGNSEAGHLNLGAGRIVKQDPIIINDSIADGTFFKNPAFMEAIQHVKRNRSRLHLMGMLSDGQSAHATPEHLYALLELLSQQHVPTVFLHFFPDGRDSSPRAGKELLKKLLPKLKPGQAVATIIGRFYAMDRRKAWSRTELAYNAIVMGKGACVNDPLKIFDDAYGRGLSDEFIEPHVLCRSGAPVGMVQDSDSIIFFNHRSDRARQLAKPFVQKNFLGQNPGAFEREKELRDLRFVAMTDFGPDLGDILTAYPSVALTKTLPVVLAEKKQLYLAESEKYAHITYFFNGGYANPVNGEDREMVRSPDVITYEQIPAMASEKITEAVIKALTHNGYDFVVANFACLDMVGHTGNFSASREALQAVDKGLSKIMAVVSQNQGGLIITADHGNIEEISNPDGSINTEHSKNPVPFLLWTPGCELPALRPEGILADVAPTILELFGIPQPEAMTGESLIQK